MLKFVSENRMVIASASYTCILSFEPGALPVRLQYAGFLFNRKLRSLLNKTLREMRTTLYACSLSSRKRSLSEPMCRAKWKFVAKATALGARVPQAELFVIIWNIRNCLPAPQHAFLPCTSGSSAECMLCSPADPR